MKQAKSNSNRQNSEYRGISIRPGIRIMKAEYVRYMEIGSQRIYIPSGQESDYGSQMDVGSDCEGNTAMKPC